MSGHASLPAARLGAVLACFILLGSAALVSAGSPAGGASPSAGAKPLNIDVLALYDDFEGRFPGTNWSTQDADPVSDDDFWGYSNYRAAAGSGSVWSAGTGNQTNDATALIEDFEGDLSKWTVEDTSGGAGADYWGLSSHRKHAGNTSLWVAQVGSNSRDGSVNSVSHIYDDNMDAYAYRDVNLAGYSKATLEYYYLQNSEPCCDFSYVGYYDGTWKWQNKKSGGTISDSSPWLYYSIDVPPSSTRIGFYFHTDGSVTGEGVYIDDVLLSGVKTEPNTLLHSHDTNATASMYRGVDVSGFGSARLDYQYWIDAQAPNDTLQVMYRTGNLWTYTDTHTGSSAGWQTSSVSLPLNATLVGFRFIADGDGHAEGAYVDEMRIWGVVLPLRCTANMSASSGYEVVTPFNFSGGAGDGLAPFNWTWSFGDGTTSALQNPTHPFREAGIFTVSVTVRDAVSQSCSVQVGAITVFHDTTSVSVSPRTASFLEGESIALYGADGQGHPFDLNWTVDPANCGSFNVTTGPLATFASATSAGGSTCTVAGSVGDVRAFATFTVAYDTSVMIVDPPSADVPEGKTLNISVTDRYANLLSVLWSTTCGRVAPGSGTFTVFSATTNGGVSCTVTATFGTDRISTVISVIHDTSAIKVTPSAAAMVEGTSQIFSVVDIYTHPFDATWSVDPPSCGSFSSTTGPSVTFSADIAAGEAMCSIVVSSELSSKTVNVTVSHDTRTLSVSPRSATLIEGASQEFRVLDANGHAVAVNWTVSPSACGVLSHASGVGTTLQTSMTAASLSCNVVGRYGATSVLAGVNVVHGPPATITGVPSTSSPEAGTAITLSASAQDAAGHPLTGVTFTWSTPCGSLSGTTGSDVSIALPESAGGTSCTVTVVSGNATGTVTLNIGFAGPFTVTVTPSTLAPSGPQTLTASVKDPQGRALPDAPIVWTATCGVLSSSTGSTTTYTPPADASGGPCTVTAAVAGTDGSSQTTVAVVSAPSMILPIVGIAVVAAGGAAGFLLWRKKKGGAEATEVAAEPMIAEEIQQEPPQ